MAGPTTNPGGNIVYSNPSFGGAYTVFNPATGMQEPQYTNPTGGEMGGWQLNGEGNYFQEANSNWNGLPSSVPQSVYNANPSMYPGFTMMPGISPSAQDLGAPDTGLTGFLNNVFTSPATYLGIAGGMLAGPTNYFGAGDFLSNAFGGSGITADSIQAGMLGGENAAGAMYGAGTGGLGNITADTIQAGIEGGENAPDAMYGAPAAGGVPVQDLSRNYTGPGGTANFGNTAAGLAKLAFGGNIGGLPGGGAGGSMPWNLISGGMNVGSGILGLLQRKRMEDMAKQAFGAYSNMGDPYAAAKALQANPNSVTSMPGYQFGMDQGRQAIRRTGAANGSGGNEAIALARYTPEYAQNFYQNEFARLMNLGAGEASLGQNAGQLALMAQGGANNLMSSSLGSIGYGITRGMGYNPNDMMQRMLMSAFR